MLLPIGDGGGSTLTPGRWRTSLEDYFYDGRLMRLRLLRLLLLLRLLR